MLHLIGEINEKKVKKVTNYLQNFEQGERAILLLCSSGGDVYSALAIYDLIRQAAGHVEVRAYGKIFSAATIILAAGHTRLMSENAWLMVHDSPEFREHPTFQGAREEDQWAELLALRSHLPAESWRKLSKETTYLTAKDALQYGLIESILKEPV